MKDNDFLNDATLFFEFVADSKELIDHVDFLLVKLEKEPEDFSSIITEISRALHSIKGTSGILGLNDIKDLSQKTDELFKAVETKKIFLDKNLLELLFDCAAYIRKLIDEITQSEDNLIVDILHIENGSEKKITESVDITPVINRINELLFASPAQDLDPTLSKNLLDSFILEAREHFETIEPILLTLEKNPDNLESINDLFRSVHTIKGNADYVGIPEIKKLAHHMEGVLDLLRKKKISLDSGLIELLLNCTDALETMVDNLSKKTDKKVISDEFIKKLLEVESNSITAQVQSENVNSEKDENGMDEGLLIFLNSARQHIDAIGNSITDICNNKDRENALSVLLRALTTLNRSADYMGQDEFAKKCNGLLELAATIEKIGFDQILVDSLKADNESLIAVFNSIDNSVESKEKQGATKASYENVESSKKEEVKTSEHKAVEEALNSGTQSEPEDEKNNSPQKMRDVKTVRVDQEKLDTFMNLVGELVVVRNAFNHMIDRMETEINSSSITQDMKISVGQLNRISDNLQGRVMEMRMVPAKVIFQRFPRMVRDIAKKQGKKVELIIQGEDTEIDKTVAELIGDPLVHLIRNSVDHGIETPDKRTEAAKSEVGKITLRASNEGNTVCIEIIDDGNGVDIKRVKNKAIERGLVTAEAAEHLSQKEIINFIFSPGFSTSENVTEISGRGVGMDVVKTNIQKIKGTIDVSSHEGKGSNVRMSLPLTLAVFDALMVGAGENRYAIPLDYVRETINVRREAIETVKGREVVNLRGDILGLIRLSRIVNSVETSASCEEVSIVILQALGYSIGIIVDKLYRRQEILIKPLDKFLTTIKGFSGATIMGDGRVILVLDPVAIVKFVT